MLNGNDFFLTIYPIMLFYQHVRVDYSIEAKSFWAIGLVRPWKNIFCFNFPLQNHTSLPTTRYYKAQVWFISKPSIFFNRRMCILGSTLNKMSESSTGIQIHLQHWVWKCHIFNLEFLQGSNTEDVDSDFLWCESQAHCIWLKLLHTLEGRTWFIMCHILT